MGVRLDLTDDEFNILYDIVFEDTTDDENNAFDSLMGKLILAHVADPKPKFDKDKLWEALKGAIGR